MSATRTTAASRERRPTTVGWIAIIVFVFLAGLGAIGALAAVGAVHLARAGPRQPAELTTYVLPEESIIYDRTGKIELARFGDAKREIVDFERDPADPASTRTTAVEDKTFWENAGFDPVGDRRRRRSTRCAATAAARRRSPSSSSAQRLLDADLVQDPRPDGRAQAQGDHPVDPGDPGVPGRGGQAEDHHRLPQPELLRQPELRREGRGPEPTSASTLEDIDPGRGRDHRRRCRSRRRTTTSSATPIEECTTTVAEDDRVPGNRRELVVPEDTDDRPAPQPDPRPARRGPDADVAATQYTRRRLHGREGRGGRARAARPTPRWIAPHFVWAVRDELADQAVRRGRRPATPLEQRRPARHHHARRRTSRRSPRSGSRRRPSSRTRKNPARGGQGARLRRVRAVDGATSRTRTSTTARSSRSTTRPAS